MTPQTQSELAKARQELESASARLRAIEARAEAEKKWSPKGGEWVSRTAFGEVGRVFDRSMSLGRTAAEAKFTEAGFRWPTYEAAASAQPYLAFHQRLVALAQELNPSGKVGGTYYITVRSSPTGPEGVFAGKQTAGGSPVYCSLFETREAADRAAEIMNRDGWKCPA